MFSFKERISLVYLATQAFENVLVLPSTKYIVSSLTFPGYFLKSMDEKEEEHARLDAILFKNYFMKELNLAKRYVGTERDPFMIKYNSILKSAMAERLEIIPRFLKDGVPISASIVRELILNNRLEEALAYVPEATRSLLRAIVMDRYDFFRQ
jgi:[citrate (pro-3S)-lyase] ligase